MVSMGSKVRGIFSKYYLHDYDIINTILMAGFSNIC